MENKKIITTMIAGVAVIAAIVFGVLFLTRNVGKTDRAIDAETATQQMENLTKRIDPATAKPRKSSVEVAAPEATADELPELDTNEVTCPATTELFAEIWASPEKAGKGTDGWMREMAEGFNHASVSVNGKPVSVQIRTMSSGLGVDYMATGKAMPAGYTPSSMLFVDLLEARGVDTDVVRERTVGNIAGILLDKEHHDALQAEYGNVDLKAVTDAVGTGKLTMGYTNPFTSSTGLNFLVSTLLRYDPQNPLSEAATEGFRQFQANVPFVALTTVQMNEAAERGALDGFVTEWQLYANDPSLNKNYVFTPFGYRHDNPLVACAGASDEQRQILERFAKYCDDNGADLATKYGFNGKDDYVSEVAPIAGSTLVEAQKLYKKNKDTDHTVIAVFVADVSGSMAGQPLAELQASLVNSMRYINQENHVGLVSYSDSVTIDVPVAPFDLNQQSLFKGAVEDMRASGGTATYDAIVVAADMIEKAAKDTTGAKHMIFVLSDGETNMGVTPFNSMRDIIGGLRIPVYTIGYNANIDALKNISSINEAASINASTDDVTYQLKNLFNANM
jgi:Ca-activated chloride channel family protein